MSDTTVHTNTLLMELCLKYKFNFPFLQTRKLILNQRCQFLFVLKTHILLDFVVSNADS